MIAETDVLIVGGGIAGLWLLHALRDAGYSALLLEKTACGAGQTVAAQGMVHGGIKYAFEPGRGGLRAELRRSTRLWFDALAGKGPVPLDGSLIESESQYLWLDTVSGTLARRVLSEADSVARADWPEALIRGGFGGKALSLREPVLDVTALLGALLRGVADRVRLAPPGDLSFESGANPVGEQCLERALLPDGNAIAGRIFVFTAGAGNETMLRGLGLAVATQRRPLGMVIGRGAPFPLFGHYFKTSDFARGKPTLTITTHQADDGAPVWYVGGEVAEQGATLSRDATIGMTLDHFRAFLPDADVSSMEWSTWLVDRAEAKTEKGTIPQGPVVRHEGNAVFAWPTKLTFAPLLAGKVLAHIERTLGKPARHALTPQWRALQVPAVAAAPWEQAP